MPIVCFAVANGYHTLTHGSVRVL